MPLKSAQNYGFTLVELLLVITIMLIMAGAMIPSFNGYLKNQSLKQAQERLKSDLRSVQNKALTGALYDRTVLVGAVQQPVTHWGVRFNNNSRRYDFFIARATNAAQFATECANYALADRFQNFEELPEEMIFKSPTGCLYFSFLNGGISTSVTTSPVYFGYSASNAAGNCRSMQFNPSGLVFNTNVGTCP
ncbi:prepilin-type N-terminal cleavage/methylation domain-containing protein [candidate division WWE3 bacterium]|uniref:Prepilin-type N-terminal cleavage/methylation domain-containing protein n=1 Tax=candidate division WWE3 bacterium TaxID=2053526 RepID=A0A7X9HI78_UNCKA|nr:prepilin-type N-terminal cleavage/methylation domain-containing protein [candidate division WWE3 bacterium]